MRTTKTKTYEMELLFRALADRTRLRLLNLMGEDEVCVCFFVEALNLTQPKISRHLAYLRRAKIVSARRDGKWMHYRVITPEDPHAAAVFQAIRAWLAEERAMHSDRQRLVRMCCSPNSPAQLRRAPKPAVVENAHS
jgi:ArsR family transcriptional regulator, arsenate/arsenite/antimonite-responsive transcriptional repressor